MEKTSTARKILIVLDLLLILSTLIFIFWNSLQTDVESDGMSTNIAEKIGNAVPPIKEAIERDETVLRKLNSFVRSMAHVTEFMVLGATVILLFILLKARPPRKYALISASLCILIGVLDEFLQLFVSGRGCQAVDVLKDSLGAILGILFVSAMYKISKRVLTKRKNSGIIHTLSEDSKKIE